MMKGPPNCDDKIVKQPTAHWWVCGVALLLVGLVAVMALALWESRVTPVPLWDMPWTWLWIASPFLGWTLAVWLSHWRRLPSFILLAGAVVTCLGAVAIVLGDVLRPNTPGGMNPYASAGAGLTFLIVPLLQWLLLVVFAIAAAAAWLATWKRSRLS